MLTFLAKPYFKMGEWAKRSFMEDLCKSLDPDLDLQTGCTVWFQQAVLHCASLRAPAAPPHPTFLAKVGSFFLASKLEENYDESIRMHPELMRIDDCKMLLLGALNDYITQVPLYSAETQMSTKLWYIITLIMSIFLMLVLLLSIFSVYHIFRPNKNAPQDASEVSEVNEVNEVNVNEEIEEIDGNAGDSIPIKLTSGGDRPHKRRSSKLPMLINRLKSTMDRQYIAPVLKSEDTYTLNEQEEVKTESPCD